MDSLGTIIIIAFFLIASVAGIAVIQKREQEKAKIRQQVAKFRYRANEAGSILENFSAIPIGQEARALLLQYIFLNLKQACKLTPNDHLLNSNLENIKKQLENTESNIDKQRLNIPKDHQQLNVLISNLSKLGKYLLKFKTMKAMAVSKVPLAINKIMLLISEAKICAYIQQGQKALAEHNYVSAQRNFQVAQQMLNKFTNKNSRLTSLESELQGLVKATPKEAANKNLNLDHQEEKETVQNDNIFGPKKKW